MSATSRSTSFETLTAPTNDTPSVNLPGDATPSSRSSRGEGAPAPLLTTKERAIRVTGVRIDAAQPEAVTGWTGRNRTRGTAYLEIFDTKGWSATRATSTFEVITEQKPNEPVVVLDFTRKS